MSSSSSSSFTAAAEYLSNAPHLSKVSNSVKLELYALYKCITVSKRPQTARPALFDFTSRAKWDAWDKLGRESNDEEDRVSRYLEIARSLGWKEDSGSAASNKLNSQNIAGSERNKDNEGGGVGSGRYVSVLSAPDIPAEPEDTLHGRVLENDVNRVIAFLDTNSRLDINAKDEYGYTPLHLAADRGHKDIVALLLQKGADVSIKDSDDYTAFNLADLAGHQEIRDMLS